MQGHHKASAGKRILCTLVSCVCFRGFPVSVVGMHFQLDPDSVGVCQYALGPCRRVVELCLSSEWSIRDTVRLTLKFFFEFVTTFYLGIRLQTPVSTASQWIYRSVLYFTRMLELPDPRSYWFAHLCSVSCGSRLPWKLLCS